MTPRLATKLSLAMALVTLAALATLGVLAVTLSQSALRERISAHNRATAALAARAVERYVASAAEIVQEASTRPKLNAEVSSANWAEVSRVLENLARHFSQFDYVFVLDPQGRIRARVPYADTIGQDFSFRDFFQGAMSTGRLVVSRVYTSRAAGRPVVAIAVPVLDGAGTIRGVLVGALSLARMSQFLLEIGLEGGGGAVYVVDGEGALVGHSDGIPTSGAPDRAEGPVVDAVRGGQAASLDVQHRGARSLAAFAPIPSLGWGVVAAKPTALAYAAATRLGWWLGGIAVACAATAGLLGWALAHRLTRPLHRLTDRIEELAVGEFAGVQVPVDGDDEVSQLARSFNAMGQRLEASYRAVEAKSREVQEANEGLERELEERRRVESEIRRLNEDLECRVRDRTRRLEAANAELEAFTYTVSHDLKAPLRAMDGFARALEEDYPDRLDATGRRYLEIIMTSARRMGALIDDLLRYSRIERREIRREAVHLRSLLAEICGDLREQLRLGGLTVDLRLEVETVQAERAGLREALANLVENAVKFTAAPGGCITVTSCRAGDEIVLSVTDPGIGFDMRYHDRIFRIFERLHTQAEYPGTGVGLGIVRKVAERHGGRVWARSEPGRGSTFSLALPVSGGLTSGSLGIGGPASANGGTPNGGGAG